MHEGGSPPMPPSKGVDDESSSIPKFIGVSTQSVAAVPWCQYPIGGSTLVSVPNQWPQYLGVSTQSVAVPRWRDPNGGIAR